ncbi:MAG: isopeptide-forming domain-containing fimbrial protein [Atopobiaceae bacterium]|nr:isopeptide-forming domain-containing fimbrial protein [Atopobiaceae bacterium]
MKQVKRIFAFAMTLVMALAVALPAFAQTKEYSGDGADGGTITINNAANGETYTLHKVFDATVGANGEIAYQYEGNLPTDLQPYFQKIAGADGSTNYVELKENVNNDDLFAALEEWAKTDAGVISETSDGSKLQFTNLPYGYYVVTTTHETQQKDGTFKSFISVDSTNPSVVINDKNETKVTVDKEADGESYNIGDTITYTATFGTTNYLKKEVNNEKVPYQVTKYVIDDTLPEYLSNVTVTSVKIVQDASDNTKDVTLSPAPQFENKQITIPWVNGANSLYKNGSQIVITYTAKLTDTVNIDANNTNTVTITPYAKPDNGEEEPWDESWHDDEVIKTYAAAIKKIDGKSKEALAGAKFKVKGLEVEKTADGVYTVVSYNAADNAQPGTEMETDSNGMLYIVGLKEGVTYTITETVAPNGYNKLTGTSTFTAQKLSEEVITVTGERHYDAKGNLVSESSSSTTTKSVERNLDDLDENALKIENNKGTEMPSTGGIGTTIFYVVGGVLVAGSVVMLLTKRRMADAE